MSRAALRSRSSPSAGQPRSLRSGHTLIEALAAAVVLTLGLLGTAALQWTALAVQRDAQRVQRAVLLAEQMLERMQTNPAGQASGAYASALSASAGNVPSTRFASADVQAQADLAHWRAQLAEQLGPASGQGLVRRSPLNPARWQVVVVWQPSDRTAHYARCPSDLPLTQTQRCIAMER